MIVFLCLIFGVVTLAYPPARNVFTALLFLGLVFVAFCLRSPSPVPVTSTTRTTPHTTVVVPISTKANQAAGQKTEDLAAGVTAKITEVKFAIPRSLRDPTPSTTDYMQGTITNTNAVSIKFDWVFTAVKVIGYDANQQAVSETYGIIHDATDADAKDSNKHLESGTYIKPGQSLAFRAYLEDAQSEIKFTKIVVTGVSSR